MTSLYSVNGTIQVPKSHQQRPTKLYRHTIYRLVHERTVRDESLDAPPLRIRDCHRSWIHWTDRSVPGRDAACCEQMVRRNSG